MVDFIRMVSPFKSGFSKMIGTLNVICGLLLTLLSLLWSYKLRTIEDFLLLENRGKTVISNGSISKKTIILNIFTLGLES
jgi:hypothetical protein